MRQLAKLAIRNELPHPLGDWMVQVVVALHQDERVLVC